MRVLHLIDNLDFGGAQRLLADMLPLFKAYGIDADLLLLKRTGSSFEKELETAGFNISSTGLQNEYSPWQVAGITRYLENNKNRYNLIHSHLFPAQYWIILSGLFKKINAPLLTTEHNTHNTRREKKYFRSIEKYVYSRYDHIICISTPAKRNLLTWLPELEPKTTVIQNGVNIKRFSNASAYRPEKVIKGIKSTEKIILMVASMTRQKDHAALLRAAALLSDSYHYVFVGEGPQKEDLIKQAAASGLSERVHFLGLRSDVERLIKTADLFVLSSKWEGFGLVAVEAMAGGVPVISSDVPGLSDVVGGAGFLFEPSNEKQLADSIEQVLSSNRLREQLIEEGLKRAEKFSLDQTVRQYMRIYEALTRPF